MSPVGIITWVLLGGALINYAVSVYHLLRSWQCLKRDRASMRRTNEIQDKASALLAEAEAIRDQSNRTLADLFGPGQGPRIYKLDDEQAALFKRAISPEAKPDDQEAFVAALTAQAGRKPKPPGESN